MKKGKRTKSLGFGVAKEPKTDHAEILYYPMKLASMSGEEKRQKDAGLGFGVAFEA